MPATLNRYYGSGELHFITCTCYHRLPLLFSPHSRTVFVNILGEVRDRLAFRLFGYVVMPNHFHLLISEPPNATPSTVMQILKQRSSHLLRTTEKGVPDAQPAPAFSERDSSPPQFWQRRFHDFNVWSHYKKIEKLEYMHMNPVKLNLVNHPNEWPWSSWSNYEKREAGLLRVDELE
jgi:putative transposase